MIPIHMPEDLGKYIAIKYYAGKNHPGNMANKRSHYGIIIYANNEPIICYRKCHIIVEASSFGSEFVALRIATDMNEDLWYKLRCFGVHL